MGRRALLAVFLMAPLAGIALEQTRSLPLIRNLTAKQITVSRLDSEGQAAVKLRWRPISGAHRYVVSAAPGGDFTKTKPVETRAAAVVLKVAPNTTYLWRVKAVHKNGQRLSDMPAGNFSLTVEHFP